MTWYRPGMGLFWSRVTVAPAMAAPAWAVTFPEMVNAFAALEHELLGGDRHAFPYGDTVTVLGTVPRLDRADLVDMRVYSRRLVETTGIGRQLHRVFA